MSEQTISDRIVLAAGGLNYREISGLTGTHPERVRRYMQGDAPGLDFIAAFCRRLGVSADWLVLGRGPMSSAEALRADLARASNADLLAALAGAVVPSPSSESPIPAAASTERSGLHSDRRIGRSGSGGRVD